MPLREGRPWEMLEVSRAPSDREFCSSLSTRQNLLLIVHMRTPHVSLFCFGLALEQCMSISGVWVTR